MKHEYSADSGRIDTSLFRWTVLEYFVELYSSIESNFSMMESLTRAVLDMFFVYKHNLAICSCVFVCVRSWLRMYACLYVY